MFLVSYNTLTPKLCITPLVTKMNKFCSEVWFRCFCLQLYIHIAKSAYMILNEINIKMNHTINTTLILHII